MDYNNKPENEITMFDIIRNCATNLRDFGIMEWTALQSRLPKIIYNRQLNPNKVYEYIKVAVQKDEAVTPPRSIKDKLYNQHTKDAIEKLIMEYEAFDLDVFLELLEDIQEVTYNAVPINIPNIEYGTSNSQAELNLKKMSKNEKQAFKSQVQHGMKNLFGNVGSLPTRRGGRKRKTSKQSKARRRRSRTMQKRK